MAETPELPDDILETDIDRLYKLVKKQKRITFDDAAKQLGKKKGEIVEWGGILEDHKLVNLHYPVFGEPDIRIVEKSKKAVFGEKKHRMVTEEKEQKHRKPLPLGKIFGCGMLALVTGFLAYVYYIDTLYAINIRSRVNQYLTVSRDFVTSAVPALDGVFSTLDSIFRGQFYLLLFPIIIVAVVAFLVSGKLGAEREEEEPEPKVKKKEPKREEKPESAPEAPKTGEGKGLPGILKLLRR